MRNIPRPAVALWHFQTFWHFRVQVERVFKGGWRGEEKVWWRVIHTVGEILIIDHNGGCHNGNVIRRLSAPAVLTAVWRNCMEKKKGKRNALKTRWLRCGKKITRSHVASKKTTLPGTSHHVAHLRLSYCFCCFDHQVGSIGSKLYFGPLERSETILCNPPGSTNGIMSYLPFSQFVALVQAHKPRAACLSFLFFACFSHWQGNHVHTSRLSEFSQNACQTFCPLTQHARHVCVREEVTIASASLSDCMTHQG